MLGKALGEKDADGDAVSGRRVVVAGGVADEEDATFGDGADALMEGGGAERTRDQFGIGKTGNAAAGGSRIGSAPSSAGGTDG